MGDKYGRMLFVLNGSSVATVLLEEVTLLLLFALISPPSFSIGWYHSSPSGG